MATVRFLADYIFTPDEDRRGSVKYRARFEPYTVRQQCADKAIAAGVAELADPLDHDGNGKRGGSRPASKRRVRKAKAAA